ncbi:hypothetical protein LSUE1_G001106 [Lachnellula suecica]|uniref:Uncharacterized protein n=1 Tax=Lachnellula suecica TaxID=602035 RepID=A0A8T9CGB7_9HELO|nr:hypothetical protein LSUE1_G001106 [Lachnellula suecica]
MPLSHSRNLLTATSIFGTIFIAGGLNAIFRPGPALEFFDLNAAAAVSDQSLVDTLMLVYGVRDIFIGPAMYSAAYSGDRKHWGLIVLAGGGVAFVDGLACWLYVGKGEWNHWGYPPLVAGVGAVLLGVLD